MACCGFFMVPPLAVYLTVTLLDIDVIKNSRHKNIDYNSIKILKEIITVGCYIYCSIFLVFFMVFWYYAVRPICTNKYLQSKINFKQSFYHILFVFFWFLQDFIGFIIVPSAMFFELPFDLNKWRFWIDHKGHRLRYFGKDPTPDKNLYLFQVPIYRKETELMSYLISIIYTMQKELKARGYKPGSVPLLNYMINMFLTQNCNFMLDKNQDVEIMFDDEEKSGDDIEFEYLRSKSAFYQNMQYLQSDHGARTLKELITMMKKKDCFHKNEEYARFLFLEISRRICRKFHRISLIFLSILILLTVGYVSCFINHAAWIPLFIVMFLLYCFVGFSSLPCAKATYDKYAHRYGSMMYGLLICFDPSIREYRDIKLHGECFQAAVDGGISALNRANMRQKWYISFAKTFALNDKLHEYLKQCDENAFMIIKCNQLEKIINNNVDLGGDSEYNRMTDTICQIILDYLPVFVIDDKKIANLLQLNKK